MFHTIKYLALAPVALALPFGAAATAQESDIEAKSPEIVKRGPDGRAQIVKVGNTEYHVCAGDRQDDCIQPRAAGLDWGDRPLRYWPADRKDKAKKDGRSTA